MDYLPIFLEVAGKRVIVDGGTTVAARRVERALNAGALVEVIAQGKRLGLDPADPELLKRYESWRGLDSFMVSLATDGLTRLFGISGPGASAIRRFGMAGVQRLEPLKRWFMDEARGGSGDVPELMQG